jgi:hypothetical protein
MAAKRSEDIHAFQLGLAIGLLECDALQEVTEVAGTLAVAGSRSPAALAKYASAGSAEVLAMSQGGWLGRPSPSQK